MIPYILIVIALSTGQKSYYEMADQASCYNAFDAVVAHNPNKKFVACVPADALNEEGILSWN